MKTAVRLFRNHRNIGCKGASLACLLLFLFAGSGCAGHKVELTDLPIPQTWHSAAEVNAASEKHLESAAAIRERLLTVQGERTLENTLLPYNDMLVKIDQIVGLADFMANVHPDASVREAADASYQQAQKFLNDLRLDRSLYEALGQVKAGGLDTEADRFLTLTLRNYRRSGVDKDDATRKELATLFGKMISTGQEFSKAIREDRRFIELASPDDLDGLPADYIASHQPGLDGKIKITTDYADYDPFMKYSAREDLRRDLFIRFRQRGYPANDKTLKELLDLRYRYATTLGYPNWAEYNAEDKMVKHAAVISDFIDRVEAIARPRMEQGLDQLLAMKKVDSPQADRVHEWDASYYLQKVRLERFGVDPQEVRAYFEFSRVKDGVIELAQELFGVSIKKVTDADVWYANVEAYDVFDDGKLIGRFYLDLHPREGKYSHVAVFPVQTGIQGRQIAVAALVANFPGPGTPEQPALLEHQDAINLLHEFGHLMHDMLAYKHRWVTLDGISCEWDFVEVPSQLLEEWGWDAAVLRRFAHNYQTDAPIPETLVAKMKQAKEFGEGVYVARLLSYAALSLSYHNHDPSDIDLLQELKEMLQKYSPYPYEEGTYLYDSFTHLDSYSSMYYTYLWSLVLAKDICTKFEASGLMDKRTALSYRQKVLEPGGSRDGADMVRDFLGRDYSFDVFQRWLQE